VRSDVALARLDGPGAMEIAGELAEVFVAAHHGTPRGADPFFSAEQFVTRLGRYAAAPGFALVTARDAALAGYVFGYPLPPEATWWNGLLDPTAEGFTTENGTRTFALCELQVRADHRGQGLATRLHDELVSGTCCRRTTVLVRPENPAGSIYRGWGYEPVGRLKPFPGSPTYLALVRASPTASSADAPDRPPG
jgi:ribosomal protein S18 acetylase RimI-like enzyme